MRGRAGCESPDLRLAAPGPQENGWQQHGRRPIRLIPAVGDQFSLKESAVAQSRAAQARLIDEWRQEAATGVIDELAVLGEARVGHHLDRASRKRQGGGNIPDIAEMRHPREPPPAEPLVVEQLVELDMRFWGRRTEGAGEADRGNPELARQGHGDRPEWPGGVRVVVGVEVRRPDASRNDPLDLRAPLVADRIRLIALEFRDEVMGPAEGAIAVGDAGATSDRLGQRPPFREIQMDPHRALQPPVVRSRNRFVEAGHVGQQTRGADQALVEGLKNAAGRRSIEAEIIGHDHRRGQHSPFRSDRVSLAG